MRTHFLQPPASPVLTDPFLDPATADELNVLDTTDPVWGLPTHVRLQVLRERSTS